MSRIATRPQIVLRKIFFDWLEFYVTRAASRQTPLRDERDRLGRELIAALPGPDFSVLSCYERGLLVGSGIGLTQGAATRGPWATQLMEACVGRDIEVRAVGLVDWRLGVTGLAFNGSEPRALAKSATQRDRERLSELAPYLAGHWPVHNLEVFRDFWLNRSTEERELLRTAARGGQVIPDLLSAPTLAALAAAGWLLPKAGVYFSALGIPSPIFVPGRRLRELSYHQGELLS
jgi:hypothetical protein